MAISTTETGATGWTIEEFSEDMEFKFRDDGETRDYRHVARMVITREINAMATADADAEIEVSSTRPTDSGGDLTLSAAGTDCVAQVSSSKYEEGIVVVSNRINRYAEKGSSFMQQIQVWEGVTEWSAYPYDVVSSAN